MSDLHVEKIGEQWWIEPEHYGPYATRKEAEEDRRGLDRFEKHADKPGFVTCEMREQGNE